MTSAEERVDSCLTGTKFDPAIRGERSGRLTVEDGDRRHGGTVNERDGRDRFMRDGKIPRGHGAVEGYERWPLVRCGATGEATGSGGRGCRETDDEVDNRPSDVLGR